MVSRRSFGYYWLVFVTTVVSIPAMARFQITDADEIDRETALSTEAYIDHISYRYPLLWNEIWEQSHVAYRISAGSFNQTRFDFHEQIKLASDPEQPVIISFKEDRSENLIEIKRQREIELIFRTQYGLFFSLLGDGETRKKYGDLGFTLGCDLGPDRFIKLSYWSVDHYYNQKREMKENRLDKASSTVKLETALSLGPSIKFRSQYVHNSPLIWQRLSHSYVYRFEETSWSYHIEQLFSPTASWYFKGYHQWKNESKEWLATSKPEQTKALRRRVNLMEVGHIKRSAAAISQLGLGLIERDAHYQQSLLDNPLDYWESYDDGRIRRKEPNIFATHFFPGGLKHYWQTGIYVNHVQVTERKRATSWQSKLQTGWNYQVTDKSHIFLNVTWNLDDILQDLSTAPNDNFRPWGGGNLQIMATF